MRKTTEGPALFLDSASIQDMKAVMPTGAVAGITTNPSLMAKEEKGDYLVKLEQIAAFLSNQYNSQDIHLSVEVTSLDVRKMIEEGLYLYGLLSRYCDVHIKIPMMLESLTAISELDYAGVPVNATCIMHAEQAKLAMDAGASYVSFFYNRMKDGGVEFPEREVLRFRSSYLKGNKTKIICGSIRRAEDVVRCWEYGADVVTAGLPVIRTLTEHHKTTEAIQRFQKDLEEWLS